MRIDSSFINYQALAGSFKTLPSHCRGLLRAFQQIDWSPRVLAQHALGAIQRHPALVLGTVAVITGVALVALFKRKPATPLSPQLELEPSTPSLTNLPLANEPLDTVGDTSKDPACKYKATISVQSRSSAAIELDREYCFGKRLKDKNGNPITILPSDRYISLVAYHGEAPILNARRLSNGMHLPSTILQEVKEGDTLEFYLDENFYSLTCKQMPTSRNDHLPFEEAVKTAMIDPRGSYLFNRDVKNLPVFFQHRYNNMTPQNPHTPKDFDPKFYEEDQTKNGGYKGLVHIREALHLYKHIHLYYAKPEQIHCYKMEYYGREWLVILVPHIPSKNQVEPGSAIAYHGGWIRSKDWHPAKGHRLETYCHGSYEILPLYDFKGCTLGFNKEGYLEFSKYPKEILLSLPA